MRVDFEEWAQDEIARLLGEADVLKLALERFRAATGHEQPTRTVFRAQEGATHYGSEPRATRSGFRRGKYDKVIERWTRSSGADGFTMNAMMEDMCRSDIDITRPQLRSLIFAQKARGRVRVEGDRYVWVDPSTASASKTAERHPSELANENAVAAEDVFA